MSAVVAVTGASGFVGRVFIAESDRRGLSVRPLLRRADATLRGEVVGEIDGEVDLFGCVSGCDVVVHLAARTHVMKDAASDPLAEFRKTNVAGTLNLARQAAANGVRRFIYVSSIKVNGEVTTNVPFTASDEPNPIDAYAISKMEAESGLRQIAQDTGMEVVIIRPPIVYGAGVKGNFLEMMHWLQRGVPLPLGAINNRRSVVGVDNLVDLLIRCVDHPAAANEIFLVSDGIDLSTTELLCKIANFLEREPRLIPVSQEFLVRAFNLIGKGDLAQRLCSSLQVDIKKTQSVLNWHPPISQNEGFERMVKAFLGMGASMRLDD